MNYENYDEKKLKKKETKMKNTNLVLGFMLIMLLAVSTNLLATDYLVEGAGSNQVNGVYVENGTNNGKPKYEYAAEGVTFYLFFLNMMDDQWVISEYNWIYEGMEGYYYVNSSASTPPSSGWETGWGGDSPAPSVSEAGASLSYNTGGFIESTANDGSMANSMTITFSSPEGMTFSGSNGTFSNSNYTSANVPTGLTVAITRNSDTELQVNLSGNASSHTNNDDVNDLTITFLDVAFNGGTAADVSNSSKNDLLVDYYYDIATLADLQTLSNTTADWDGRIIQTADIDASGTSSWNGGAGFSPIGNTTNKFQGNYNGDGYTIDGLTINRPSAEYVGLFSYTNDATISNLGMTNVNITGDRHVGGLIGYNAYSTVSNSYSTGSVNGDYSVGGLVGLNYMDSNISNSYSTGNVACSGNFVGGLAGMNYSNISNSYSTGSVNGDYDVGGLVGMNNNYGSVSNSYSTGSVTGVEYVGGLVGKNQQDSEVSNSYSTGSVNGAGTVGGLVGINNYYCNISNSYSTGSVNGDSDVGGLVGINNYSSVNNSFWDTQTSGQSSSPGGGTGKTTAEMQTQSTFTDAGWDFTDIWTMDGVNNDGYSYLQWQYSETPNTAPIADDISVITDEDVAVAITMTGSDVDGDSLTFAVVTAPVNGTYDGTTYTPNADYNGADSFTYTANDGTVDSDPATVTITVNDVIDELDAPTNVAVVIDGNNLTISWDVVANANSYLLYSSSDPYATFPDNWILVDTVTDLTCTIESATEDKMFYCVVASTETEPVAVSKPVIVPGKEKKKFDLK